MSETVGDVRVRRILRHDFNSPPNDGGFYEVVLDDYVQPPSVGEHVIVADDDDDGMRVGGKVRALIAIVEPETI